MTNTVTRAEQDLAQRQFERAKNDVPPLEPRHIEHCRLLPSREHLLTVLPRGSVAAEVGVADGRFTQKILQFADVKTLYLIDAWSSERYGSGLSKVKQQFAAEIATRKVILRQGYSTEVLADLPDSYFDWIYIDTNHTFGLTLQELRLGARKVKAAGYLAGHDFSVGNAVFPMVYGVIGACHTFCREAGWRYRWLSVEGDGAFSFCLERMPV